MDAQRQQMNASNRCSQEMNRVFFFSLVFTCFVGSIIILLLHIIICACDIFLAFFLMGGWRMGSIPILCVGATRRNAGS